MNEIYILLSGYCVLWRISWPSRWRWSALLVRTFYLLTGETVYDFVAKFGDLHRINVFIYKLLWVPLIWKAGKKAIVQSLSLVWFFATPGTAARQASLSFARLTRSLPKLMSIESAIPSNHLILCRPLLLPPSIFLSVRVFSSEPVLCIRWSKYWCFSFTFSIIPSNCHDFGGRVLLTDWCLLGGGQGCSSTFCDAQDSSHGTKLASSKCQ